jgi:hypothetical protein
VKKSLANPEPSTQRLARSRHAGDDAENVAFADVRAAQPIGVWRVLLPTLGAAWAELVRAPVQEFDAF